MGSNEGTARPEDAEGSNVPPAGGSLLADAAAYGQSLLSILRNALDLVALEGQLAAVGAVKMLACGIGAAVLALTSWLALLAALAVWLHGRGWPLEYVLLGISLLNALLGALAWLAVKRISGDLGFAATRRQLGLQPERGAESDAG